MSRNAVATHRLRYAAKVQRKPYRNTTWNWFRSHFDFLWTCFCWLCGVILYGKNNAKLRICVNVFELHFNCFEFFRIRFELQFMAEVSQKPYRSRTCGGHSQSFRIGFEFISTSFRHAVGASVASFRMVNTMQNCEYVLMLSNCI